MSLCDTCRAPGQCCTHLYLITDVSLAYWLDEPFPTKALKHRLPFKPLPADLGMVDFDMQHHKLYGTPAFTCPKLTPQGRCSIYHSRPQLCRDYQPLTDSMCAEYTPPAIPSLSALVYQAEQLLVDLFDSKSPSLDEDEFAGLGVG